MTADLAKAKMKVSDPNSVIPPLNIDSFGVRDLAGIEYYGPATTPAQFKSSPCGTLLLWTRDK
jgi:hypothetical protein